MFQLDTEKKRLEFALDTTLARVGIQWSQSDYGINSVDLYAHEDPVKLAGQLLAREGDDLVEVLSVLYQLLFYHAGLRMTSMDFERVLKETGEFMLGGINYQHLASSVAMLRDRSESAYLELRRYIDALIQQEYHAAIRGCGFEPNFEHEGSVRALKQALENFHQIESQLAADQTSSPELEVALREFVRRQFQTLLEELANPVRYNIRADGSLSSWSLDNSFVTPSEVEQAALRGMRALVHRHSVQRLEAGQVQDSLKVLWSILRRPLRGEDSVEIFEDALRVLYVLIPVIEDEALAFITIGVKQLLEDRWSSPLISNRTRWLCSKIARGFKLNLDNPDLWCQKIATSDFFTTASSRRSWTIAV